MTRRSKTVGLAVVTLAGLAGSVLTTATATAAQDDRGRARNVIYLLGDGMGRTHVTAGRERFYGADGKLTMETPAGRRAGLDLRGRARRPAGQPTSSRTW